jgi:hypothetical protein
MDAIIIRAFDVADLGRRILARDPAATESFMSFGVFGALIDRIIELVRERQRARREAFDLIVRLSLRRTAAPMSRPQPRHRMSHSALMVSAVPAARYITGATAAKMFLHPAARVSLMYPLSPHAVPCEFLMIQ